MEGVPPSDDQVRYMVETNVPKYFLVVSEEDLITLGTRKQVKAELVRINHLVRTEMKVSYRKDEPDDYSDMLFDVVSEAACEAHDAY
jgi:hypothetical protein